MKWLDTILELFKGKDLTEEERTWWINAGCPTFMIYTGQERRIADLPRPGAIPWDETYERRSKPHTY
jgi:hypothetical protein